jgi:alpha-ribazole phosphatase
MITYKLHFIRHGQTSANRSGQYIGRTDAPLCDEGIEELLQLRKDYVYPKVEAVYTSPLARCIHTADILYPQHEAVIVDDLTEMDFGYFEGKTAEELQYDPSFLSWLEDSRHHSPPGGEDGEEFLLRITGALQQIFRDMMAQEITNAAVITHGGVIMTLLSSYGFPRERVEHWAVDHGQGFSIMLTPQMWSRDGMFEVIAALPLESEEDLQDALLQEDFEEDYSDDAWDDIDWESDELSHLDR